MSFTIKELRKHKKNIDLELQKIKREYDKCKTTNHILHAIISIFTVGVWVVVWFLIASSNGKKREHYEELMAESEKALLDIEYSIEDLRHA